MSGNKMEDTNTKLTAMSIADIRAYVSSELARIKDDISDLYEKFNQIKDASATDKLLILKQLNQEIQGFNNRLNDFSVVLQKVLGDVEHSDSKLAGEVKNLLLEVDNRMLRCRTDMHNLSGDSDEVRDLGTRMDAVETTLGKVNKSIGALEKSDKQMNSKIQKLVFRLGAVVAVLLWLADKFGPGIIKDGLSSFTKKPEQTQPTTGTVVHDTVHVPQPQQQSTTQQK